MYINIQKLREWLDENPNYTPREVNSIMIAVEQFESDCIDEDFDNQEEPDNQ